MLKIKVQNKNNKTNGVIYRVDDSSHDESIRSSINKIHQRFCSLFIRKRKTSKIIKLGSC